MIYRLFLLMFLLPSVVRAETPTYKTEHIENKGYSYNITVAYPQLINPNSQQKAANKAIQGFVSFLYQDNLEDFTNLAFSKAEIKGLDIKDRVDISFEMIYLDENRISIRFDKSYQGIQSMSPIHNSYGFNYSLKKHRVIKLADLFKHKTPYLVEIAAYCIDSLEKIDKDGVLTGWIEGTVSPQEENLSQFAFDHEKLIIYFSDDEVDNYNPGMRKVEIPVEKLSGWLKET